MKRTFLKTITLLLALPVAASAVVFTNDITIAPDNIAYEGQPVVISNATLTVDGPHTFASLLVAPGGVVTHSFSASGTIITNITVLDEPQILTGTNEVMLATQNIIASLITVKDASGMITYQTNLDFIVRVSGGDTFLSRSEPSSIPDGSMVLVSYASPGGTISAGLNLTVNGNLSVNSNGFINANGRGLGGNNGTGNGGETGSPQSGAGAGYGGYGGMSSSNALGGNCYGVFNQPITLGSGGGQGVGGVGGAGGGVVKLAIGGNATIDGTISANGANATNSRSGGGSGGSIWITAQTVSGAGAITAHGGSGEPIHGGGGGGGRISIQCETQNFTGTIAAYGGLGWKIGGAGTVYTQTNYITAVLPGTLVLDNGGRIGTNSLTTLVGTPDVIVRGSAIVTPSGTWTARSLLVKSNSSLAGASVTTITISSNVVIEPGGAIHTDGLGGGNGPGVGTLISSGIYYSGGGGHGGYGGNGGVTNARGGNSYGSATSPTTAGSFGGGSGSSFTPFGGAGGGGLRMTVNGSLTNHGRISADGKIGSGTYAGGGGGGSVWLTIGKLYGAGLISANGGPGILPGGGGGGGGRVAVACTSNFFGGNITAYGGSGTNYGGAGTVYLSTNQFTPNLIVDNGGYMGTNTTTSETSYSGDLTVSGSGVMVVSFPGSGPRNVLIKTNGTLITSISQNQQFLTLSGSMTIDAGGLFSLEGRGNLADGGTGRGNVTLSPRGGASHGGYGALNFNNSNFGIAYGSITTPSLAGSGGGSGSGSTFSPLGGAGGGALRLEINGSTRVLTVNGRLSANGLPGELNSGGGSGGSLLITVGTLAGNGVISANGGAGNGTAGGGGGGRIAINYTTNLFTGQLTAFGGSGAVAGGAGTIYTKRVSEVFGSVLINNGSQLGTNTPLSSAFTLPTSPFNLTIGGGASVFALTQLPQLSNLVINASSVLTMRPNETNVFLDVLRNATIAAGGAINVDGKGFGRGLGTAPGATLSSKGAGGGHGGVGGGSQSGALGGTNYGSSTQPVLRGSGGGAGSNTYVSGCEGGGAIRMTVGGMLNIAGSLGANGNPGIQDDSGGGAGGSIWITAGALTGGGNIFAKGGDGDLYGGGGGAGGRIAIYSPTNTFNGLMSVAGGIGHADGQIGSIFITTNLSLVEIISGRVTNIFGQGVTGASVVFLSPQNGIPVTSITDSNGNYSVIVPRSLNGTLTPTFGTNVFFPTVMNFNTITTSFTDQNFLMVETIIPTLAMQKVGTNLILNWNGFPSLVYRIESSTNLVDWMFFGGNFYGAGPHQEIVPMNTEPAVFFRVRGFGGF